MVKKQKEKGITLIALVVTIIVLLILASISIAMLTGDNSIINQSKNAKDTNVIGQEKEYITLAYSSALVNSLGNGVSSQNLQDELDKCTEKGNTTVWNDEENEENEDTSTASPDILYVLFKETNHCYKVENGTIVEANDVEYVPKGSVARIGKKYYETLQAAIDDVPEDGTETEIVLLKDISENVSIGYNYKNILLNLNGKTINSRRRNA